jgi:hypothetical protein
LAYIQIDIARISNQISHRWVGVLDREVLWNTIDGYTPPRKENVKQQE